MVYNFEKIIIECLAKKYGVDIDKNLNEQVFNSKFVFEYRRVLDKLMLGLIKELIESEQIYKIMISKLTVTQRLYIVLFYFFDLSAEEVAKATFSTIDSVHTQRNSGIKKIRNYLNL